MKQLVSYKLKADHVRENERLLAAVFDGLAQARRAGLRYASLRCPEGVSVVHLVSHDGAGSRDALTTLPGFKAFVAGIIDRCETPPASQELATIGAYGFFDD